MGWIHAGNAPYNPDSWTVRRFINHIEWGNEHVFNRPYNVSPERWAGMWKWYYARIPNQDWVCE